MPPSNIHTLSQSWCLRIIEASQALRDVLQKPTTRRSFGTSSGRWRSAHRGMRAALAGSRQKETTLSLSRIDCASSIIEPIAAPSISSSCEIPRARQQVPQSLTAAPLAMTSDSISPALKYPFGTSCPLGREDGVRHQEQTDIGFVLVLARQ
jgi:hypothetical protein